MLEYLGEVPFVGPGRERSAADGDCAVRAGLEPPRGLCLIVIRPRRPGWRPRPWRSRRRT